MLKSKIFVFLFCLVSLGILAQNFPTKHYTIREGLAQMQVMDVLTDSQGVLWAATKGGLTRYDGFKFKNYKRADGDSLSGDLIRNLQKDSQGNIWICTSVGISRFDGSEFKNWRFSRVTESGSNVYVTKKDKVLVISDQSFYQIIKGELVEIKLKNEPKELIRRNIVFDIHQDKLVFVYESKTDSQYRLYELDKGILRFIEKTDNYLEGCYLYGDKGIFYTHKERLRNETQYWFLPKGENKRQLILTVNEKTVKIHQKLPFNFVFSFQGKLAILDKNTTDYQQYADNFLNHAMVQIDPTGIWAGTETGLWRILDNGTKYIPASRDAVVWSMVEDKFNRLWTLHYNISTPIRIHEGKRTTNLTGYQESISKQLTKPFSNAFNFRPVKDQYQNLWLPAVDGLIRYDYKKYQVIFDSTYSFFITEDKKRNLIISSVAEGVNIVENKPPYKVTKLRETDGLHPNSQMLCVFVDSKGKHWYGGIGITTYDYERKKAFRYKMKSDKVPFRTVFSIVEDSRHTLWFGTTSGLFRYLPQSDSFVQVAKETIKGFIFSIGLLDDNHLICGNYEDVFVMNLSDYYRDNTLTVKTFNNNNGFMGLEPGQAGIYKTHDGKTWITSSDVLSIFDPKELDLSLKANKPIFTKIDGSGVAFTKNTQDSVYTLSKGKTDGVRIEFGSTGFDNAIHPKFSYKLDSLEWSGWQEEAFVILYNLNQGNHIIKVKTQILGEQKGLVPMETSLRFQTNIKFWQSPNFVWYLLFFTILILGFAIVKWIYEWRLRKKMESQQKELEFLKVAANQAQMNPHFIFNILQVLQSYIITEKWKEAKSMVVKLGDLVRNYLEATMIDPDNAKQSIFSTEIELRQEIDLLTQFVDFEQIKGSNKFSAKINVDENINIKNLTIPPMIIQPIVENAIKHGLLNLDDGEKGELMISLSFSDNMLCFVVSDTGVGKEKAAEIKAKAIRSHISRGQELVKKRIELLNGAGYKITLQSEENQPRGTKVTICFDYK